MPTTQTPFILSAAPRPCHFTYWAHLGSAVGTGRSHQWWSSDEWQAGCWFPRLLLPSQPSFLLLWAYSGGEESFLCKWRGKGWECVLVRGISSSGDPELSACALRLLSLFSEPLFHCPAAPVPELTYPSWLWVPPSRWAQKRLVDRIWDREGMTDIEGRSLQKPSPNYDCFIFVKVNHNRCQKEDGGRASHYRMVQSEK